MLKIKVRNLSHHPLPDYKTAFSSGMDLMAYINQPILLKPLQRVVVPTGLYIEIPENYEAQIRPRSGLAANYGISVLNSPGTIDADYRGEIKIILINLSDKDFLINDGTRIAQIIFSKIKKIKWIETEDLDDTKRGKNGFGHTGVD